MVYSVFEADVWNSHPVSIHTYSYMLTGGACFQAASERTHPWLPGSKETSLFTGRTINNTHVQPPLSLCTENKGRETDVIENKRERVRKIVRVRKHSV